MSEPQTQQSIELRASDEAVGRLAAKLGEEIAAIRASESVSGAAEALEQAESEMRRLNAAYGPLNERLIRLRSKADELHSTMIADLVADPAADLSGAVEAEAAQAEHRLGMAALQALVEHRQPCQRIAVEVRKAEHLEILAHEIEKAGTARLARMTAEVANAVELEGGLSVDPRSTVGGLLLERAQTMRLEASRIRSTAHEMAVAYQKRQSR
jgi:hypothetical protein